jgi:hypothetical protein
LDVLSHVFPVKNFFEKRRKPTNLICFTGYLRTLIKGINNQELCDRIPRVKTIDEVHAQDAKEIVGRELKQDGLTFTNYCKRFEKSEVKIEHFVSLKLANHKLLK